MLKTLFLLSGDPLAFNAFLFTLKPLPYGFDALEPHIDTATMTLHHDKHHAAYVDGANKALEKLAAARDSDDYDAIAAIGNKTLVQQARSQALFNRAGNIPEEVQKTLLAAMADATTLSCRQLVDGDGTRAAGFFSFFFFFVAGRAEAAEVMVAPTGRKNRFSMTLGHCRNRMASTTPTISPRCRM